MIFQEITSTVLAKAIEVHSILGPGLFESAYKECLIYELKHAGLQVKKEVPVPLIYKDVHLDHGYRMDILVEEKVVIEIKVAEYLSPVHHSQVITYMRLGKDRKSVV